MEEVLDLLNDEQILIEAIFAVQSEDHQHVRTCIGVFIQRYSKNIRTILRDIIQYRYLVNRKYTQDMITNFVDQTELFVWEEIEKEIYTWARKCKDIDDEFIFKKYLLKFLCEKRAHNYLSKCFDLVTPVEPLYNEDSIDDFSGMKEIQIADPDSLAFVGYEIEEQLIENDKIQQIRCIIEKSIVSLLDKQRMPPDHIIAACFAIYLECKPHKYVELASDKTFNELFKIFIQNMIQKKYLSSANPSIARFESSLAKWERASGQTILSRDYLLNIYPNITKWSNNTRDWLKGKTYNERVQFID